MKRTTCVDCATPVRPGQGGYVEINGDLHHGNSEDCLESLFSEVRALRKAVRDYDRLPRAMVINGKHVANVESLRRRPCVKRALKEGNHAPK